MCCLVLGMWCAFLNLILTVTLGGSFPAPTLWMSPVDVRYQGSHSCVHSFVHSFLCKQVPLAGPSPPVTFAV